MAFMRKIKTDIQLSELEALALHRASIASNQKGEPLAKTLGDYLYMLYEGLLKRGDIEENYDIFESRWFCDYYGDTDEDSDCMVNDLYEDMVCQLLGVKCISDMQDNKEVDALVKSTSDSADYYQDETTCELICEESDRRIAGALFERINHDIDNMSKR